MAIYLFCKSLFHNNRKLSHSRCCENCMKRKLYQQFFTHTSIYLSSDKRMASQCKEIIMDSYFIYQQNLGPDLSNNFLNRGARRDKPSDMFTLRPINRKRLPINFSIRIHWELFT